MRDQRRNLHNVSSSILSKSNPEDEEEDSNPFTSSSKEERERIRRNCRVSTHSQAFKVKVPKFGGRLDLDEFLEWLQTAERVF